MRYAVGFITSLFLFSTLTASDVTNAEESMAMEPLSETVKRINFENPDPSEMGYIGIRCGALYYAISGFIRDPEMKELAEQTEKKGTLFLSVGRLLSYAKEQTLESMDEQTIMFGKVYAESMKKHKLLNNSIFSPMVKDDIAASNKVYPLFVVLHDHLTKQEKTDPK